MNEFRNKLANFADRMANSDDIISGFERAIMFMIAQSNEVEPWGAKSIELIDRSRQFSNFDKLNIKYFGLQRGFLIKSMYHSFSGNTSDINFIFDKTRIMKMLNVGGMHWGTSLHIVEQLDKRSQAEKRGDCTLLTILS